MSEDSNFSYSESFDWIRSRHFIKQLRKDNIDISLVHSEISDFYRNKAVQPWSSSVLRFLRSNQMQLVKSILVLVDAIIIIMEIILEINSLKHLKTMHKQNYDLTLWILSLLLPLKNSTRPEPRSQRPAINGQSHVLDYLHLLRNASSEVWTCRDFQLGVEILQQSTPHSYLANSYPLEVSTAQYPIINPWTEVKSRDYVPQSHHISEILHYISIFILTLFLVEVLMKIFFLKRKYFGNRFELFDGIIIVISFVADILFVLLNSQEVHVMIVFLLWRVVRVINGLLMHEKQRDEFRIALQKKARKLLDLKLKILLRDKEMQQKNINALQELCYELDASKEQVARCKPKSRLNTQLRFLSDCLRHQIFPATIRSMHVPAAIFNHPPTYQRVRLLVLRSLRRRLFAERAQVEKRVVAATERLHDSSNAFVFADVTAMAADEFRMQTELGRRRLNSKVKALINAYDNSSRITQPASNAMPMDCESSARDDMGENGRLINAELEMDGALDLPLIGDSSASEINCPKPKLVTLMDGVALSAAEVTLLEKGPKFMVSTKINENTELQYRAALQHVAYQTSTTPRIR